MQLGMSATRLSLAAMVAGRGGRVIACTVEQPTEAGRLVRPRARNLMLSSPQRRSSDDDRGIDPPAH